MIKVMCCVYSFFRHVLTLGKRESLKRGVKKSKGEEVCGM